MAARPPVITDLNQALGRAGQPGVDFFITPAILDMFRSDDATVGTTQQDSVNRFMAARTLFQTVRDNHATEAVFYKLHDKSHAIAAYNRNRLAIRDEFIRQFGTTQPSLHQKTTFFTTLRANLLLINPRNADQQIQLDLVTRWSTSPHLNLLASARETATNWFTAESDTVKNWAQNAFFGVASAANARAAGTIYDPAGHNWGTNVAWALSVARQQLPIRVISPLTDANTLRTSRVPAPPQPLPSAFALEMSIAVMMGYTLNVAADGSITMNPPLVLPNSNTTGVPGNGILPTANQQIDIYRACVMERWRQVGTLANDVAGWSLANHKAWRETLTSPPLANKATFNTLRTDLRRIQIAAIVTDLNTKRTTGNGQNLRDRINNICNGADNDDKRDLADALESMRAAGTLTPLLDTLTATEHNRLRTMLANNPCTGATYNALRAEAEGARLDAAKVIALDTLRTTNVGNLRKEVRDAAAGGDPGKVALINALALMQRKGTLTPILDLMTATEHGNLRTMLTNAPFAGAGFYDALRSDTDEARYDAAMAATLDNYRTTNVGNLRKAVRDAAAGGNQDKINLVNALALMQRRNELTPILDQLTATEHGNLRTMLTNAPFAGVGFYDDLRGKAENARIDRENVNVLDNLRRTDVGGLRTTISDICTGVNADTKRSLANALALMRRNNALGPVLGALTLTELGRLNTTLANAPCVGVGAYDDLRTDTGAALLAARQAAERSTRSQSASMTTAFDSSRRVSDAPSVQPSSQPRRDNNLGRGQ